MIQEPRCAACGRLITPTKVTSEDENVFCDKICRANYHKGTRHTPALPAKSAQKPLTEKQKKYVGRLIEGLASMLLGIILTWWSKGHDVLKGYHIIFYGPVLWGIIALSWGTIGLWKSKKADTVR